MEVQYTHKQLKSIEYILKSFWLEDFLHIDKPEDYNSILSLVDEVKLSKKDTREVRQDMLKASFDEKYIAAIQNWKKVLSNNLARPRYNKICKDCKNLMAIRSQLIQDKKDLKEEIKSFQFKIKNER